MSKPFLDKKATDQLNLTVLRRVDPDTEQVCVMSARLGIFAQADVTKVLRTAGPGHRRPRCVVRLRQRQKGLGELALLSLPQA